MSPPPREKYSFRDAYDNAFVLAVDRSVVIALRIEKHDAFRTYFAANEDLLGLAGTVRNDFRKDIASLMEKNDERML